MPNSPALTSENFSTFHESVQTQALKATKTSAGLPSDISFYKSIDPNLSNEVDILQKRVLHLVGAIIGLVDAKGKGKTKGVVVSRDGVVDDFHSTVVDSMDLLLERTDICLDEYSGKLKRPTVAAISTSSASRSKKAINPAAVVANKPINDRKPYLPPSLQHASHIAKPQVQFQTQPNNSNDLARPHANLVHKYNAKVPLGYVLQKGDLVDHYMGDDDDEFALMSSHPYYYETTHLQYPKHAYEPPREAEAPPILASDSCTYVKSSEGFTELIDHLLSPEVKDLAVDLEHHSYRTYRGFLCLMQISTRGASNEDTPRDFIIDLLVPEIRTRMPELNAVFTDPTKIKVFHGAESDITWLQQDFGLYVVGLFDTFHASKLLELPRHSLATLLSLYADFTPDKKYQQADWRIRPLPQEMLEYAQSDTHWLLYIYDCVRGALLDKSSSRANSRSGSPDAAESTSHTNREHKLNLLREALHRSSVTSLRIYTPEIYDAVRGSGPGGWDSLAKKWNKGALVYIPGDGDGDEVPVYRIQRNVYRAIHAWRDRVSREEDESTRYVLPNHFIFTLAETHPVDMVALLGVFRNHVPPIIKKKAQELLVIIKQSVKRGLEGTAKAVEPETAMKVDVEPKQQDGPMQGVEEHKSISMNIREKQLWGSSRAAESSLPSIAAPSSTLFSSKPTLVSSPPTPPLAQISAATSSLFGAVLPNSTAHATISDLVLKVKPTKQNPAFQALVARINSTLVIAPSAPKILAEAAASASPATGAKEPNITTSATSEHDRAVGMQIDSQPMPFVPASERATRSTVIEHVASSGSGSKAMDDMGPIVVVGRKGASGAGNKKKRKHQAQGFDGGTDDQQLGKGANVEAKDAALSKSGRKKQKPVESANGSVTTSLASPGRSGEEKEEPAFDFSAVPNVLDVSQSRSKKQKRSNDKEGSKKLKKKKPTNLYGDFPAAPRARNEVKSGNISQSYRI